MHVLDQNVNNPRLLGFSTFFSSNALRNSSYCWTFGKEKRVKDTAFKKYNDQIYNLPNFKSTRYTTQGFGTRKDFRPVAGKGCPSPSAYNLFSIFDYNIRHKKGASLGPRINYTFSGDKYRPEPATYNAKNIKQFGIIPIILKSRQGFFYDDDIKKKKATVSMQKYSPKFNLVEMSRFDKITFGIGDRPKMYNCNNCPGPGTYMVPGNFDRGYRGKLVLN